MRIRMFSTIIFLFFAIYSNGQFGKQPASNVVYRPVEKVKVDQFFDYYQNKEGGLEDIKMVAAPSGRSKYSTLHPKFKQTYKGLEIYGSSYSLHLKEGFVNYTTGQLHKDIDIDITPNISEDAAKSNATRHILKKISKDSEKPLGHDKIVSEIKGLVVIDVVYPKTSGVYTLAYKIEVKSLLKPIKYEVVTSAVNQSIIFDQSLIMHGDANGIGKTFYYGNQNIVTDSLAPNRFVLRDMSRGKGNTTYTNASGTSNDLIVNTTNVWENDEVNDLVAIDAHYTTAKFYDMMLDHFGYSGIDGDGGSMNPVIHVGGEDNYLNAFWDGQNAYFGHGDCHHGPLTTLSVLGHEFTHGITQYNSNLIYNGESGALNESLSDIFGKSLEYFVDNDNFSWELGPEFAISRFSQTFRSMSDPNLQGNPKRYKGEYWEDGADVHFNSGVLNHWFYLLVEGVTGNSEGIPFAVEKMDIDEVLQVVFLCQTSYLTPSSDYPAMYMYSLLACEELYGANSPQYASMQEAWKAVGLPSGGSNEDILDLAISTPNIFQTSCISNDFYSLEVTVSNVGTIEIEKGETLEIGIDGDSKTFTLEEPLIPGGNLVLTIDDVLFFEDYEYDFFNISLIFGDENFENNSAFVIIENFAVSESEIEIIDTQIPSTGCNTSNIEVITNITNNSCQEVPANTEITLNIYDGSTLIKEIKEVLSFPLQGGVYYPIKFSMPAESFFYEIVLVSEVDSDPSNNSSTLYIDDLSYLDDEFTYDFDDNQFNFSFDLSGEFENAEYEGNSYITTTGSSFASAPCPDPDRNFENSDFSDSNSSASVCLDLTSFTNPSLSFDMVQFRSGIYDVFEDPEISAQTSMMKLSYYNDNETFSTFINNLPEGQVTKHRFNLPQGFVGKLELSFYNNTGNGFFSEFSTDEVDAILIDNLKLEDVNSTNNVDVSNFKLQPNPAFDILTLYAESTNLREAQIFNTQGQLMKNIILTGTSYQYNININDLKSGYYIMKVLNNADTPIMLPFVKI